MPRIIAYLYPNLTIAKLNDLMSLIREAEYKLFGDLS